MAPCWWIRGNDARGTIRPKRIPAIDKISGKSSGGLKAGQIKQLQTLYRLRVSANEIISREMARRISAVSADIKRQVALLLSRKGQVACVIVGSRDRIWIPELSGFRLGPGRLKGLRCVHTHLKGEPLSREDITDLMLTGLDLMAAVAVNEDSLPGSISFAHILPDNRSGKGYAVHQVPDIGQLLVDFKELIRSLEEELAGAAGGHALGRKERAVLVGVTAGAAGRDEAAMDELEALARSDGIDVVETVLQHVKKPDPRFLIRKGKLGDLALRCLQTDANLMIFNNELSPAQVKTLTDSTDLRIIDRSQLILDIFSRRAVTREGKIQVELAQLKYLLPRLATKNTAMSRLTGGIGGRGPGETKLEINRRRVRERIARLNRELRDIRSQRAGRRHLRNKRGLPVISIVGYTNAGKSTLLNSMTHSHVAVGNRLFETLDPSSRRLRFPREREAIITDTVGFIRDLPESLMEAFAATLEELHDADLLLHVVDAFAPRLAERIETVEDILERLELQDIPRLLVLNKADLMPPGESR
ncbi:MAG: GTPase HflX, partial [Deltaproteobacteria bacterium]|nr:GTPase HflX [Deltaproteobacteria bacterium]